MSDKISTRKSYHIIYLYIRLDHGNSSKELLDTKRSLN